MSDAPTSRGPEPSMPRLGLDNNYVTAMSHFYRGELGRIMAWRARLDTTTTWAITTTTTIFTVSFSFREVPHIIFFFNVCIITIMLWIESRRYRFYDAFRARVRMLEAHFLVPIVMQNTQMLHGEWQKLVCEDLLLPSFKLTRLEAIGRRLKRNYIFIYLIILAAWLTKIFIHAPHPVQTPLDFYRALAVSGVPSWSVAFVFIATIVTILGITYYVTKKTSGEVTEFGGHRAAWRL